jgi:hypothetical protein
MTQTYTLHATKGREHDSYHHLTVAQVERKRAKLVKAGYFCTIVPDEPPTQQGTRNGSLR